MIVLGEIVLCVKMSDKFNFEQARSEWITLRLLPVAF